MGTVIMVLIFPIGLIFYFFDRRVNKENMQIFDNYIQNIKESQLSDNSKISKIDEMFYQNGYDIMLKEEKYIKVKKKHFNLGILFMMLGALAYFGPVFYYIYYRFILKPRIKEVYI